MTRREFLETGVKGIMIASIPGIFKFDPAAAFTAPMEDIVNLNEYYTHFGVDEKIILEVMQTALGRGGDYCDVYFQHNIANTVGLEDNAVNRAYANVDFGVGIRVVSGDQTGYSFTEEITPQAMKLAAATAANIANRARTVAPAGLEHKTVPNYYPVKTLWNDVKIDKKIPYLQNINDKVFSKDTRIIKSRIRFSDSSSYVLIANSEGMTVCDYRPMTSLKVSCTAEQNAQRETNGYSLAARHGIEFFTPENVEKLADESVRRTIDLFEAVKPEAGEMEVVLAPGSSGILLHEAIGHGMEADFNRKNISIFADKIGKPVAPEFVTIVDNGTNLNVRGSLNIDDEGNDTEETYLVQDGILTTYLHDRISAKHYKARHTGNGRRESFRYAPMPRMRNTYMLPGPHTPEEIIKSVKKGLYAETFTNGQVFIGAGDFTFYVQSGNLIEDGKLTRPVKDINIIGNGPEVLANIVMVGNDLKLAEDGWTCGKDGQSVPVSQGLPTVKVSSITVGGVS
ncbi:MAG: TldD/PmbA family protein [Candidatus Zixiibacteriota bacterium]|nr:MAG: TldD/PmbA family protein [candidate division Zixibacteria bacterium]